MGKQGKNIAKNYEIAQGKIDWNKIGKRILQIQNELKVQHGGHFSQKNMGEICGHSQSAIHDYITGDKHPDLETLDRLARFSGHTLSWLVYGEEETPAGKEGMTIKDMLTAFYEILRITGAHVEKVGEQSAAGFSDMRVTFSPHGFPADPFNGLVNISDLVPAFDENGDPTGEQYYNYTSWETCRLLETFMKINGSINAMATHQDIFDTDSYNDISKMLSDRMNHFLQELPGLTPMAAKQREDNAHEYDKTWKKESFGFALRKDGL
ncbi:helix-turn-helix domain-containing protein [Dialister sp.]|jgi:hypothetical protein|uniref:helix-turn-helix domain-containing protein n=1 Tax=Dialister sp. TaxID=1955814 RepID=UPI003A5BB1DC